MDRIKKIFKIIHIIGWVFLFTFFNFVLYGENVPHPLYTATAITIISIIVFYSHFFLLIWFSKNNKIIIYIAAILAIFLVSPFIYAIALRIGTTEWFSFQYIPMIGLTLVFIILSGLARAIESWFLNTLKNKDLEKQAIQAELSYLKSQINPHFIFNTLNNIHTLAYKQSPFTTEAIMRLSSLMRYMIYDSNADTVSLTREINYLQDFIGLQQLRFIKSPIVDLKVEGDTDTCHIAPLLFIHLLENAYKHSSQLNEGDIKVTIEVIDEGISFSIRNPHGKAKTIDEPGGFGLANLRKRLQLLYPDRYTLDVSMSEKYFEVLLRIDHVQNKGREGKADMLYN